MNVETQHEAPDAVVVQKQLLLCETTLHEKIHTLLHALNE